MSMPRSGDQVLMPVASLRFELLDEVGAIPRVAGAIEGEVDRASIWIDSHIADALVEFGEVHLVVCDGQSILAEMQHVQSPTHRVAESTEHGHQNAPLPFRNGGMVVVHNVIDGRTGDQVISGSTML